MLCYGRQTIFGEGHMATLQVDVAADGVMHSKLLFKKKKKTPTMIA